MALKWWEKTVEYYFVKNHVDVAAIAPFDGVEEAWAGDAAMSKSNKWILIEFKRQHSDIISEKDKYFDFEVADEELRGSDGHHFIVYGGMLANASGRTFELSAQTYFSKKKYPVDEIVTMGVDAVVFRSYLKTLASFKRAKIATGSGGFDVARYGMVAGISCDGKIVECRALSEIGLDLTPTQAPDHTPSRSPSLF